jgi:phosphoglycerate dehydrogenase-like enzyme
MTSTVVLLDLTSPERAEHLRRLLPPGFVLTHGTARGDDHLKEIIRDADFAISGQVGVSADVFKAARRLKLLHKWGVGVDNIDIQAAKALGIKVARTTGSNAVPVAEFTIGLILATLRFLALGHERLRQGRWMAFNQMPGEAFCISGKTVGLIGLGAIGQGVASRLRGFGCTLFYNKRTRLSPAEEAELGVTYAATDDLLAQSDIVCLHCPLTPATTNLIDTRALSLMKRSSVLINVARGGVVVEADLAQALRDRTIRGAAMDVYSIEPLPANSELLSLDNIVVTPHLAAATADTFEPTVRRMFDNMVRVRRGEPLPERDLVV